MGRQAISRAEHTQSRPNVGRLSRPTSAPAYVDNQPDVVALRQMTEAMHNSPHVAAQRELAESMNARPAQRQSGPEEEELLQGQFAPAQRMGTDLPRLNGEGGVKGWSGLGQWVVQRMFSVGSMTFKKPTDYTFTLSSALNATEPIPRGQAREETGREADTGVSVGDVGSYGFVQYLEQPGDALTGDHQPSGAAIKENIREMLHTALDRPLTRSMAQNAYKKAITIVMTDVWHKLSSRTYGGRNTQAQILKDAKDFVTAAMEDWKKTVPGLKDEGFSDEDIQEVWDALNEAREQFFATGDAQAGTL